MNKIISTLCFSLILCFNSFSSDVTGKGDVSLSEEDILAPATLFIIKKPQDISGLAVDTQGNITAVTLSGAESQPFVMGYIDSLMPVFDVEGNFMYLLGEAMGFTGPEQE